MALHLGVETPFRPARKAHPALQVASLERARRRLARHGGALIEDDSGASIQRIYVADPFGNRIELIDASDAGFTERRRRRPVEQDA